MNLVRRDDPTVIEPVGFANTATDLSIAQLQNGNLVAVWSEVTGQPSDSSDDVDGGVFFQILDQTGLPLGDVQQVNDFSPFVQDAPEIIAFDNGGFAIAYNQRAEFGSLVDNDVFLKLYLSDGGERLPSAIDVSPDNPGSASEASLADLSFYAFGQFGMTFSDGFGVLFDTSGFFRATIGYKPAGGAEDDSAVGSADTILLTNTNIVTAYATALPDPTPADDEPFVDHIVSLVISNSRFDGPDGIPGVIDDLIFDAQGEEGEVIENVSLAALANGGFVLAYEESNGNDFGNGSISSFDIAVEFYTAYGVIEHTTRIANSRDFDMIALSSGGVAIAAVDATGTAEVTLIDDNGVISDTEVAETGLTGNQSNPSLVELEDGGLVLSFSDTSGRVVDGVESPLQVTFFDVSGDRANFATTAGDDVASGLSGNDEIFGMAGNDTIDGRAGDDSLFGGAGNDMVVGGTGRDGLRGGAGDDTLSGAADDDGINGGAGADIVYGGRGRDLIDGGADDDMLYGGRGADKVKGALGNDRVEGDDGNDQLRGAAGDDTVLGGNGDDVIFGGAGTDLLTGGAGSDTFVYRAGHGSDTITDFDVTVDSLLMIGLSASEVSVATAGGTTTVTIGTDTITLTNAALAESQIDFA